MERMLKIRGFEIKLEGLTEEENKKCDIIEEICLIDNRALRLIGWLLQKFGKDILVDGGALDIFILSHDPNSADYNILSQWILSSKAISEREVVAEKRHIINITEKCDKNIEKIAYFIHQSLPKLVATDLEIERLASILKYNSLNEFLIKSEVRTIVIDKVVININEIYAIISLGKDIYRMDYNILKTIVNECLDMDESYINQYQLNLSQYNLMNFGMPINPLSYNGFNSLPQSQVYNGFNDFHSNKMHVGREGQILSRQVCDPNNNRYINHTPLGSYSTNPQDCDKCCIKESCNVRKAEMKKKENTNSNSIDEEIDVLREDKIIINQFAKELYNKFKNSTESEKERFKSFCKEFIDDNLQSISIDLDGDIIKLKDTVILLHLLNNKFKIIIDGQGIFISFNDFKKVLEKVRVMN